MTGFCVVAVDPGYRFTGVVARRGADLVHQQLVTRTTDGPPDGAYVGLVLQAVSEARRAFVGSGGNRPDIHVAVEGVIKPNPHLGYTDVTGLLGAAVVLGGILAIWPDAVIVRPGRHGKGGPIAYPPQLWGPNEGPDGKGKRQHLRSAYDIAGAAETLIRQRQQQQLAGVS